MFPDNLETFTVRSRRRTFIRCINNGRVGLIVGHSNGYIIIRPTVRRRRWVSISILDVVITVVCLANDRDGGVTPRGMGALKLRVSSVPATHGAVTRARIFILRGDFGRVRSLCVYFNTVTVFLVLSVSGRRAPSPGPRGMFARARGACLSSAARFSTVTTNGNRENYRPPSSSSPLSVGKWPENACVTFTRRRSLYSRRVISHDGR